MARGGGRLVDEWNNRKEVQCPTPPVPALAAKPPPPPLFAFLADPLSFFWVV